ncbi:MAG TPA: HIT family protein [Pirellulales bacterium]|nr:HIT family protein [Pirellulales bacterium]
MTHEDCDWCRGLPPVSPLVENASFFALLDRYPVNHGHALIISKRHVRDVFGLDETEFRRLHSILVDLKEILDDRFHPDGYNIGANCGAVAGQTVFHFHLHVIPRYRNDVPDPRGGIRNLKPPLVPY